MDCGYYGVLGYKHVVGWTVDVRVCYRMDCGCKCVLRWTVNVRVC